MAKLYEKPAKRHKQPDCYDREVAKATDQRIGTMSIRVKALKIIRVMIMKILTWYNYFLVRGYAVVTSSSFGLKRSDGVSDRLWPWSRCL